MQTPVAGARVYVGLFLVTLATLAFEILITRIFSVTLWYHFAFAAISLAMLGLTVGSLVVFLRPAHYPPELLERRLGSSTLVFALLMTGATVAHLLFAGRGKSPEAGVIGTTFVLMALPFIWGGISVAIALTRYPRQVGRLYAVDLAGAAAGCVALVLVLGRLDGIYSVFAASFCASLAAALFLWRQPGGLRLGACVAALVLGGLTVAGAIPAARERLPFRIDYAKGFAQEGLKLERWNSFSRIAISRAERSDPIAWSLSSKWEGQPGISHDWLMIDAWAGTPLIHFQDDWKSVEYLQYDITNVGHHLRGEGSVLIVGSGGGRDILSALSFGKKRIVAVEMNDDIVKAMTGPFAAITGNLHQRPGVTLVNDEARSFTARQTERFDLIQLSFIDTFAATAAGAFVLAENSLYTTEGWTTFLGRLGDRGLLSVSRGFPNGDFSEVYRLVALARESLRAIGVARPEQHILVVGNEFARRPPSWGPMANVLVSPTPLGPEDVRRLEEVAARLRFTVYLRPGYAGDENFAALATGQGLDALSERIPLNLAAPTDDSPFFFNMLRPRDWFFPRQEVVDPRIGSQWSSGHDNPNLNAVGLVLTLCGVLLVLTLLTLVLPLRMSQRQGEGSASAAWPSLLYFAFIGFGFMLLEVSQMQRLTVFLGHPVYGVSVILFTLLLTAGLGSFTVSRIPEESLARAGRWRLGALVVVALAFGVLSPVLVQWGAGFSTPVRIAVSVAVLAPLGFVLGAAFPLGMRAAGEQATRLGPWLWGINGAASVSGSVLAVVVALGAGISVTYWLGVLCYLGAGIMFSRMVALAPAGSPAQTPGLAA